MRTNVVIDDALMEDALKVTGLPTKKETIELALKMLVRLSKQQEIKGFRGKLTWEDELNSIGKNT